MASSLAGEKSASPPLHWFVPRLTMKLRPTPQVGWAHVLTRGGDLNLVEGAVVERSGREAPIRRHVRDLATPLQRPHESAGACPSTGSSTADGFSLPSIVQRDFFDITARHRAQERPHGSRDVGMLSTAAAVKLVDVPVALGSTIATRR